MSSRRTSAGATQRPRLWTVLMVVGVLGASALLLVGVVGLVEAWRGASWRPVRAEILDVESGSYEYHSDGARPGDRVGTRITVTYRYEIDGEGYTSSRYSLDEAHDDFGQGMEEEAAERRAELSRRSHITAYVHPDDPSEAVLARAELAPAVVTAVLGAAGLLTLGILALRRPR